MALHITSSDPRNAEWIALRGKQIAELHNFQKEVEAAKAKFFKDIEKKREDLIATHKREKNDLLNKEQTNSSGTALPKKSGDRPRQTLASTSKTSPYTSTPKASAVKQTTTDVINLCSDDEPVFLEQRNVPAPAPALPRYNSKTSKCSSEAPKPTRREDVLPQSPRNLGEQQRARTTTLNNANVSTDQTERNTTTLPKGDVEMSDRDGCLAEAAQDSVHIKEQDTPKSQQHINNVLPLSQKSPSLPSGITSRARKRTLPGNAFKKPLVPVIRNPLAQNNSSFRGSSQVPTSSTHDSNTTPSQCSTAATSQTDDLRSYFARKGKRKVIDISSGEDGDEDGKEADDENGDEDGDDGSSFNDEGTLSEEEKKRPSTKRAKFVPSITSTATSGLSRTEKNRFGFQINSQSKVRANNQEAAASSSSSQTLNSTAQSGTLNDPVTVSWDSTNHIIAIPTPAIAAKYSNRKAKLNAVAKITQISQQSPEFFENTNIGNGQGNHKASSVEKMSSGLQRISITPAPLSKHAGEEVDVLADESDDESVRGPGRCRIVKAPVEREEEDVRNPLPLESGSSKHKFVNGVVFPTDEQGSSTKSRIKRKEQWP